MPHGEIGVDCVLADIIPCRHVHPQAVIRRCGQVVGAIQAQPHPRSEENPLIRLPLLAQGLVASALQIATQF